MMGVFPELRLSSFQPLLYRANARSFIQSDAAPKADPRIPMPPCVWPALLDEAAAESSAMAFVLDGVRERITDFYERAATLAGKARAAATDGRFSAAGLRLRGAELVDSLLSGAALSDALSPRVDGRTVRNMVAFVENTAERIAQTLKKLPVAPAPESATEWRALIRASGASKVERVQTLVTMMREGNPDLAPSILGAGPGLSGLDTQDLEELRLYVQAASNVQEVARVWMQATALDCVRLAAVRGLSALEKEVDMEPEQRQRLASIASNTPGFSRLVQALQAMDTAVHRYCGDRERFAQLTIDDEEDGA